MVALDLATTLTLGACCRLDQPFGLERRSNRTLRVRLLLIALCPFVPLGVITVSIG